MKIIFEYDLPVSEEPSDTDYEGPIQIVDEKVYFSTARFEHSTEIRAKDRKCRGHILTVHAFDQASGGVATTEFRLSDLPLPRHWSFIQHEGRLFLHCGHLLSFAPNLRIIDFPRTTPQPVKTATRPRILLQGDNAVFADAKKAQLYSFSMTPERPNWQLDLKGISRYSVGAPLPYAGEITCYGRDSLNFVDPADGSIRNSIQIPRLDKLYSPLLVEEDLILGYTNWSAGGVVRYCPSSRRVRWQYRKRFSGPGTYNQIYRIEDVIVWVKGETEIVGIDMNTGQERWAYQTTPWLYTEIDIIEGDLVFGTAGRDGYIQRIDAATGKAKWTVFLKNGCAYFDYYQNSVILGDFDRCLHRLRLSDGRELDRLDLDGQVVGDVRVSEGVAFTVVWSSRDGKPPRLIFVDLT